MAYRGRRLTLRRRQASPVGDSSRYLYSMIGSSRGRTFSTAQRQVGRWSVDATDGEASPTRLPSMPLDPIAPVLVAEGCDQATQ